MRISPNHHLLRTAALGTAVAGLVLGIAPPASAAPPPREPVYYLALGDSLAAGFQPDGTTGQGYVQDLWRIERRTIPGLHLRNVGCPGETSRSLITGAGSPCQYAAGSQLDAAVAFLHRHTGDVAFITIDIGANDLVDSCYDDETGRFSPACSAALLPRLQSRIARILATLRAAGPDVPIVAMTYHNPFLGFWGLVPGGRAIARADQRVWVTFNAALTRAYEDAGASVADVAATFRVDDFADRVFVPGRGRLPVNVALACQWTWFCSPQFAGDPHGNRVGYRKIARTFERELRGLLP